MISKETLSIYIALVRSGIALDGSQIKEIENLIDRNEELERKLEDAVNSIKEIVYIDEFDIYNTFIEGTPLRRFMMESTVKLIRGEQNK